jgi:hypothetical protein
MKTFAKVVPVVAFALAAVPAMADDVVFDSSHPHTGGGFIWGMTDGSLSESASAVEFPGGFENEARVGAAITLVGASRFVTAVQVGGTSFPNPAANSADLTLSLYTDAGGQPGTLLWTGIQHLVVVSTGAPGYVTFTPNIAVPSVVFYTLEYANIANPTRDFGAYFTQTAPSIGASGQLMTQDSTTLQWEPSPGTNPTDGIELRISAIQATCYANCDGSTTAPALNINDFLCFQTRFAAGDSYANCDGSTTAPVLNVNDFLCFQASFATGCP